MSHVDELLKGTPAVPALLISQVISAGESDNYTNFYDGTILVTALDMGLIGAPSAGILHMGVSGGITIWAYAATFSAAGSAQWRGHYPLKSGETITVFNDDTDNWSASLYGFLLLTPRMGI